MRVGLERDLLSFVYSCYDLNNQFNVWPGCYFLQPCSCGFQHYQPTESSRVDLAAPVSDISRRDLKRLMEEHVRLGHRNFRSLAKALNIRMPSEIPLLPSVCGGENNSPSEIKGATSPESIGPAQVREYILTRLDRFQTDCLMGPIMVYFSSMLSRG